MQAIVTEAGDENLNKKSTYNLIVMGEFNCNTKFFNSICISDDTLIYYTVVLKPEWK